MALIPRGRVLIRVGLPPTFPGAQRGFGSAGLHGPRSTRWADGDWRKRRQQPAELLPARGGLRGTPRALQPGPVEASPPSSRLARVLASWGLVATDPQVGAGWLESIVPSSWGPAMGHQRSQGLAPCGGPRGGSSPPLPASGGPRHPWAGGRVPGLVAVSLGWRPHPRAGGRVPPVSASTSTWLPLHVRVCPATERGTRPRSTRKAQAECVRRPRVPSLYFLKEGGIELLLAS